MYDRYDQFKDWTPASFGACSPGMADYYRAELARHGMDVNGKRVLEIGFGNGEFLQFARTAGGEVHGIEIQPALLERARTHGFSVHGDLDAGIAALSGPVDLFALFDVLEHLAPEETIALLQKLAGVAAPSGALLVARFPNGDSPFSLPLQNGDFTHRLAIGAGIAHRMLTLGGWRIVHLGDPAWPRDVATRIRVALRRAAELMIGSLFWGRQRPSTLFHNYILAARPQR